MKRLFFLLFIAPIFSQAQIIDSVQWKIEKYFCSYLDDMVLYRQQITDAKILECMQKAMVINEPDLIEGSKKKFGSSDVHYLSKYIQGMAEDMKVNLVYNCDNYFKYKDTIRFAGRHGINKDTVIARLEIINKYDTLSDGSVYKVIDGNAYYYDRAMYYVQLDSFELAIKDFSQVLKSDPRCDHCAYYMGLSLEAMGRYDEAIVLYHGNATLLGITQTLVDEAICKRKKMGLKM